MNAVEIEEAVSELAAQAFDPAEFPYRFLAAFGAKETTLRRLRNGGSNASDVPGGVLRRDHIHLAVAPAGQVGATLAALRASAATRQQKAKFLLATDGETAEAEDLVADEPPIACAFAELPRHFGFFLPLAGISTVREIKNNPVDIKATGRLNRLYVELLRENPDWATAARRPALNRFMARLIFCFFAEDTGILHGSHRFTPTVERMSDGLSGNTHQVIAELFRAMATRPDERAGRFHSWSDGFPYVNGGLFADTDECPRFSRAARAYLLRAGELDWREINPDIFGSMIQAVADEGERGELGMHYTSVPNILKVLNPLFLDGLREQLAAAGDNRRRLGNLRRRLAGIRVFDPACGSGNFLVIAYKQMRAVEAAIVERLGGEGSLRLDERRSVIPLHNFYGIEIKGFAAEIARLALLIAEFQADCVHLSQQEARAMVLPLHRTGQITVGNALRLDWLAVCPPVAGAVVAEHDLAGPTGRLALEENGLGEVEAETYVCGNPPYLGSTWQTDEHKEDLRRIFADRVSAWRSLDYVAGWFIKAADFNRVSLGASAFVSTNSLCQGQIVPLLWPLIFATGREIAFAYTSFKWANLASHNAGVTVIIVGLSDVGPRPKRLYSENDNAEVGVREVAHINAYLTAGPSIIVDAQSRPRDARGLMEWGNKPTDGGNFFFTAEERQALLAVAPMVNQYMKRFLGARELIHGESRYCLWLEDADRAAAELVPELSRRIAAVARMRAESKAAETRPAASFPHRFRQIQSVAKRLSLVVTRVSSENRDYLPVGLEGADTIIGDRNFALYDAPLWNMALIASRLHWVWIGTVCVRMRTDFSYSNTLGWNTFPVPTLTGGNKADLTACAERILLAREAHFPATIADLYAPGAMPADLARAHDDNDEVLERIYIGRRFRNDTERLERLFAMYAAMTAGQGGGGAREGAKPRPKAGEAPRA